jgi:hypothetical protein
VTSGDARRAIVDAAKNYKGGDTSFRTHVANLFNDPKFVDKPDFGAYLYYHFGAPDADMAIPHGHHITYKQWIEDEGGVVKEIHDILNGVGINPIVGLENLIQAPNVEGQHSTQKLREMANRLKELKAEGGQYKEFVDLLTSFGHESREIRTAQLNSGTQAPRKSRSRKE